MGDCDVGGGVRQAAARIAHDGDVPATCQHTTCQHGCYVSVGCHAYGHVGSNDGGVLSEQRQDGGVGKVEEEAARREEGDVDVLAQLAHLREESSRGEITRGDRGEM